MSDLPTPTYEEATRRPAGPILTSVVAIITPHLDYTSRVILSSMFRECYDTLNPGLWRDPIKIISQQSTPFVRTFDFVLNLSQIRPDRRPYTSDLITTYNFKPLVVLSKSSDATMQKEWTDHEFYFELQPMLDHTRYLSNLQFLMIGGLSVQDSVPLWQNPAECPAHLLLLNTSWSQTLNTSVGSQKLSTSVVLRQAVLRQDTFQSLIFLDLSGITLGADFGWECSASSFPNLRILKLRRMKLTNGALPDVLLRSGYQIWSLDVRDNNLTDQGVDVIVQSCCQRDIQPPQETRVSEANLFEVPPMYTVLPVEYTQDQHDNVVPLRPDHEENLVSYLKRKDSAPLLLQHKKAVLTEQDDILRKTGLTQLYISGNEITSDGIRSLLSSTNRLQVLDAGSVKMPGRSPIPCTTFVWQPSSTVFLQQGTAIRMEALRIHHSIVTYCPTFLTSSGRATSYTLPHLHEAETHYGPSEENIWRAFMPSDNHRIRELTLTHVPTKSFGFIIQQLILFLEDATVQEQALAALPKHRRAPKALPGLKRLTLEMVKEYDPVVELMGGLSISGDEDSKRFHEESEKDFSFFGDRSKNKGKSSYSMAKDSEPATHDEDSADAGDKKVDDNGLEPSKVNKDDAEHKLFDVIKELKKFRATARPVWRGKLTIKFPDPDQ